MQLSRDSHKAVISWSPYTLVILLFKKKQTSTPVNTDNPGLHYGDDYLCLQYCGLLFAASSLVDANDVADVLVLVPSRVHGLKEQGRCEIKSVYIECSNVD